MAGMKVLAAALAVAGAQGVQAASQEQAGQAAPAAASAPASPAGGKEARAELIPTSAFAEQPFLAGPRISPDGKRLAARVNVEGKAALAIISLEGGDPIVVPLDKGNVKEKDKLDLRWYRWAGNGTLLISVGRVVPYFDDEALMTRLIAYDVATKAGHLVGDQTEGLTGDDVLWVDPQGATVLMAYQPTVYEYPTVYSVNIATNKRRAVVRAKDMVWDWYADNTGVVRAGIRNNGHNSWDMLYRSKDGEDFRTVVRSRGEENEEARFDAARIFSGSDEGYRIMKNEKTGRDALYRFNFATRQRGDLVFDQPDVDISDFSINEDKNTLEGAWFTNDGSRVHWFDKDMATLQDNLSKAVDPRAATVVTQSRDQRYMIVHVGAGWDLGSYYYYDQQEGVMHKLATVNDKLPARAMAHSSYVSYKARDGLEIKAYLTLPPGRDPHNLPLIILPHGGPYYVRDSGNFDDDVQFLANRGYAVLQPQFRGSDGYGEDFYQKGRGQWGRAMQDDLDDGMDWLAKDGVIDPKRACIVGSSYGGYAALWGPLRNPERYRCGASFAGISDMPRQLQYQLRSMIDMKRGRAEWKETVTGPKDFDLASISPLFQIDRLKVPVLLVHGDKDQRVPYKQSQLMADALQAKGKTYEFYTLPGEGHGFSSSANEKTWLDRLDAFLKKYNPAD